MDGTTISSYYAFVLFNSSTEQSKGETPANTQEESTGEEEKVLVVYTARSEELNKAVISEFENKQELKLN